LDNAPTLRRGGLVFMGTEWVCSLWLVDDKEGSSVGACGQSVTFAVVAAILAFEAKQKAL
jgi:hypothetical protein